MRRVLSVVFLFAVCSLVHSNTIYRKYRELDVPVPVELIFPDQTEQLEKEIVAELKNDQIPVHIEIVEPVIYLNKDENVEPIESGRNVAVPVVEETAEVIGSVPKELVLESVVETESVKNVEPEPEPKIEETKPIESSRSADVAVEEPAAVVALPELIVESAVVPDAVETLKNFEENVGAVENKVPVVHLSEPSSRNVEPLVSETVAVESVVSPLQVVPVEIPVAPVETLREIEPLQIAEVLRKVEQIEEIAEKQSEIINEIIAEESVRSAEPIEAVESIAAIPVVPLPVQNVVSVEKSVVEDILPKEEERSIVQLDVVEEKIVPVEKVKESVVEIAKPVEQIAERSIERIEEPKLEMVEEKVQKEKKEIIKEEPLDENVLKAVDDKKLEENVEKAIVKDDEPVEAIRQNAESTTPGNVIQQLLQNNPLTNFIQSIRPQSAASTTIKPSGEASDEAVSPAPTQPPNFIQQIATGIQGLQANVQGLFNGNAGQSGSSTTAPAPPFAFLTNLFPGQGQSQSTQSGAQTGGNVPPNPIQGFVQGLQANVQGLFNGNRGTTAPISQTTTTQVTTKAPVDDKVDEIRGSEETNESNETFENDPELYVGDEDNSALIY